jgi:hypothetical protein
MSVNPSGSARQLTPGHTEEEAPSRRSASSIARSTGSSRPSNQAAALDVSLNPGRAHFRLPSSLAFSAGIHWTDWHVARWWHYVCGSIN